MAFTAIDLFAGIGGFRLAVERNGGKCLGFSEINEDAIRTYEANFPESRETNFGDITKIVDLPKHDLLTGGVPCQSWSIAGRNLGFDDDRGQLWNDAIYLLNKSRPKAFLFENVKGLIDPRNKNALDYILAKIKDAGYHAAVHVLNSFDYGVPQSRVRIYIVGFRQKKHFADFKLPRPARQRLHLRDILDDCEDSPIRGTSAESSVERDLFGDVCCPKKSAGVTSLSANNNGFNDYFLLNDIRNGNTTVHSWEILETSEREKAICRLLLTHRRKRDYGDLDGNPLSLKHFKALDDTISQSDLDGLCEKGILKPENYVYQVVDANPCNATDSERDILACAKDSRLVPDELGQIRELKVKRIKVKETLAALLERGVLKVVETRYDFRYTKISTGLFGVNRIFLPSSNIYPTLVASDSSDYVTPVSIYAENKESYRRRFLKEVYRPGRYRRITCSEACRIQGFPADFILPEKRARWMKLIGNSVSVPVIQQLVDAIKETGALVNA